MKLLRWREKIIRAVMIVFCAFAFAGAGYLNTFAEGNTRIVRVGYIDYAGFIEKNAQGEMSGYGVEYLKQVSRYTNWKFDFVHSTWEDCLDMLETGEIDLVCTAQYTGERDLTYDFSKYPIGKESVMLYTNADNDGIYFNDYSAMDGKKVAMLKDCYQNPIFEEYARTHGFTYEGILYNSANEMLEALENHEVTLLATGSLSIHNELKLVAKFGADDFYFMTREGNAELLDPLNETLDSIKGANPYFEFNLYQKYYGAGTAYSKPLFTREEAEYIRNAPPVSVGSLDGIYPVSYFNEETGKMDGITADILELIQKKSGLSFLQEPINSTERPIMGLKSGKYSLAAGILRSSVFLNDPEMVVSRNFMEAALVAVTRRGEVFQKDGQCTVIIKANFEALEKHIKNNFPGYTIIYGKTDEECVQALLKGRADMMIQNSDIVKALLQDPHYESLVVAPYNGLVEEKCFAGLSEDNPMLMSVINKTIDTLSKEEINQIIIEHTVAKPYKYNITDFIYIYRIPIGIVGTLAAICLLLLCYVFAAWKRRNKELKENESLRILAEYDQLTGLYNKRTAKQMIDSVLKQNPNKTHGLLIVDLDNFKKVNDTKGHLTGDKVLEEVGKVFRTQFRESDIAARFGGDEFALFMTNIDNGKIVAERANNLLNAIAGIDSYYTGEVKLSASVGCSLYPENGNSFETLFEKADIALYEVKRSGKGRWKYYADAISLAEGDKDASGILYKGEDKNVNEFNKNFANIIYEAESTEELIEKVMDKVARCYQVDTVAVLELSAGKVLTQWFLKPEQKMEDMVEQEALLILNEVIKKAKGQNEYLFRPETEKDEAVTRFFFQRGIKQEVIIPITITEKQDCVILYAKTEKTENISKDELESYHRGAKLLSILLKGEKDKPNQDKN